MKATIEVLNHQPVPLLPLGDLSWDEGEVMYIGRRVMKYGSEYDDGEEGEDVGWVVMDRDYPFILAERYAFPNFDHYDMEQTMARKLQPGEVLRVSYTN
jgi:hypothetical protein